MTALADRETVPVESCDLCGGKEKAIALNASPWTLLECRDCGFVFTSPRLSDDSLQKIYSDEYYENADDYAAQQVEAPTSDHRALASRIGRRLKVSKSSCTAIDVGCGGGRLVEAFSEAGFQASGIEPSEATVRSARKAGRDVTVRDVAELESDYYDCVTAMHVLEHVTSPSEFLGHLFRITRPGGVCVIEVPNFGCKASLSQGADWYALHPSTHLSHFTPDSLAQCLGKAGFDIQSLQRLGGAGVFETVSEATASKSEHGTTETKKTFARRLLATVWMLRTTVTSLPLARRFARWVNWEVLGHGQFIRVFATKPLS